MKNYKNYNQYTSSKAYYSDLKNQNKNLNSSKYNLDKLEKRLQKILHFSYNVFNPIFKGEDIVEYRNTKLKDELDNDFDQKVTSHSPSWLIKIVNLLIMTYNKYFKKKISKVVHFVVKQAKQFYFRLKSNRKNRFMEVSILNHFLKTKPT